jgi:DNA-binding CsgD family transcriptional regulator
MTKAAAIKAKPILTANESEVIDMITRGTGYRAIADKYKVSIGTVHAWINETPERSHACARARELAAHAEDEAALADISAASDQFELAKAKELAIHRRWRAKSLNPKQYGDKVQVDAEVKVETVDQVDAMLTLLVAKMAPQ